MCEQQKSQMYGRTLKNNRRLNVDGSEEREKGGKGKRAEFVYYGQCRH